MIDKLIMQSTVNFIHKVSEIYNINHVFYKYKNHPYTTEVKCSCYVINAAGKGKIFLYYYAFRPDENELGSMLK